MRRSPSIDVTRPLPAIARFVKAAPQRPGADGNVLLRCQVVRQQWHRPTRGQIAAAARVPGQHCSQSSRREPTALPWPTTPWSIHELGCIPPYAVLRQPAVHAGAVDTAAAGSLGHTLPLSDQQQRLYPAIHTRLTGCLQGRGEPLAIRTAEPYPMASGRFSHAPERAYSAMVLQHLWLPT